MTGLDGTMFDVRVSDQDAYFIEQALRFLIDKTHELNDKNRMITMREDFRNISNHKLMEATRWCKCVWKPEEASG